MIDTSKATLQGPKDVITKPDSIVELRRRRPIALVLSYTQIALGLLAGNTMLYYSSKTGKESWGGMYAYIPLILVVVIAPFMVAFGLNYFIRRREDRLVNKIIIAFTTLLSLAIVYIYLDR